MRAGSAGIRVGERMVEVVMPVVGEVVQAERYLGQDADFSEI